MGWAFVYLMLVLKIPIVALLWIVWWAVRVDAGDRCSSAPTATAVARRSPRHPRRPLPRHPRRGPHGDPAPVPPARTRTVVARARRADHA